MTTNRVTIFPAMRPLTAGRYRLRLGQQMTAETGSNPLGDVAAEDRYLEVTAPRTAMAGTELFSTYPPPNSAGPFTTRLPQVALRRRTLPWERSMPGPPSPEPAGTPNPWLALVVVTADEATFLTGVTAPDAFSPAAATALGIVDDGSRGDALEVTRTGVDQVFPRKDELHLLAHVRQVAVDDTELAGNDDDGWVAVLLSNRLPRPGMRYRACVVSLEGQFGVLADPRPGVDDRPGRVSIYDDLPVATLDAARYAATGNPVPLVATDQPVATPAGLLGGARKSRPDAWVHVPVGGGRGTDAAPVSAGDVAVAAFGGGFVRPGIDLGVLEPLVSRFRFPVLASWEFVCEGDGDFASLMQNLDVGLLGTLPAPDGVAGTAAGPPAVTLESGHLAIAHRRRRGGLGTAWYRGPLTPREVARRPATVPFSAADQARRIATDGREDLSEAAAFEIGRLLALSAPRFVAALRGWAASGFAIRRARGRMRDLGVLDRPTVAAARVGIDLLSRLAGDGGAVLGTQVPAVDLGPLAKAAADVSPERLAAGLGLDASFVADVLGERPTTVGLDRVETAPLTTAADELARDPRQLDHLAGALAGTLRDLVAGAEGGVR